MRRPALLRSAAIFLGVVVFAAVDAIVKGHHAGMRNAVGNVSAPWALLPFLAGAGTLSRRRGVGALVGALSTVAALACYSLVRRGAFDTAGRHGGVGSMLVATTGNRWFLLGAVGGATLGAVGSWLAARGQWNEVAAVVASLLVLEPVVRIVWGIAHGEAARTFVPSPAVWAIEVLCGCAALVVFRLRTARQP